MRVNPFMQLLANPFENPARQIRSGDSVIHVRTDDKWKDFVYGYEVPERVRKGEFDWLDDAEGSDNFFKYHGTWYHLSEFTRTAGGGAAGQGSPELVKAGWQGIKNESYSSGVLVAVSRDGEQYKVASYWVTSS